MHVLFLALVFPASQTPKPQTSAKASPTKAKTAVQTTLGGKWTVVEEISGTDSSEDSESEETTPQVSKHRWKHTGEHQ